jgi:hypothetical protein
MESDDERVAAVACNALLDRAFGKPREQTPETSSFASLSDEELDRRLMTALVARGMSEQQARLFIDKGSEARRPKTLSPPQSARDK